MTIPHRIAAAAVALSTLPLLGVVSPLGAQSPVPQLPVSEIPVLGAAPQEADLGVHPAYETTLVGQELPEYIVADALFRDMIHSDESGHGLWVAYVLEPLGIEAGSATEQEIRLLLSEARIIVEETFEVDYDDQVERQRFAREQAEFNQRKMIEVAALYAELLHILDSGGLDRADLEIYQELQIRPSIRLFMTATGAEVDAELDFLRTYEKALEKTLRGEPVDNLKASAYDGLSNDVISVTSSVKYPNCGEGLVSLRGYHNAKVVQKDRGFDISIQGNLYKCLLGLDRNIGSCTQLVAPITTGSLASCVSSGGDTLCSRAGKHRAWARGQIRRNGRTPLTLAIDGTCGEPNNCDPTGGEPPPR